MKINIPDNIDLHVPNRYILTVYVHPEKFSFSLHCTNSLESCFFYKVDTAGQTDAFSAFKDLFFDNDLFALSFQKTCILDFSPLFTYVPDAIYSEKYKEDYIKLIFSERTGVFLDHAVPAAKLRVLYPVSEPVHNFFVRSFDAPEFVHYTAPLITHFHSPDIKRNRRQMIVNTHEKGVDVFCFSKKLFLLGNHFPCEKRQDALYYILYTWKQLKLDKFADSLLVAGNPSRDIELIDTLRLYLRHVHPAPPIIPDADITIPFEMAANFVSFV
ncbi:MAG: DUF3822 family protein [Dysgonamonadaceae bacterium]|jgi:hypothetical protein|nr:DUF3822 family protein [Dysgonamonadaceae bacterium]